MYRCNNCDEVFGEPRVSYESHGFSHPPYEENLVCPYCGLAWFEEVDGYEEYDEDYEGDDEDEEFTM